MRYDMNRRSPVRTHSDDIILSARTIHKKYKMGDSSLHVLKGIDLDVCRGEILAIIGHSGAGKSTLLHIFGTIDKPSEGSVTIDGTDVLRLGELKLAEFRNSRIGFIFQFHHLLPEFSALENVALPGLIARREKQHVFRRAEELLAEVGLQERLGHRPRELSGGEQQRVAVARALINDPLLVLADEPSGNLDLSTSLSLHNLMWEITKKKEKTLVIVTHNRDLAATADREIELYDGSVKLA